MSVFECVSFFFIFRFQSIFTFGLMKETKREWKTTLKIIEIFIYSSWSGYGSCPIFSSRNEHKHCILIGMCLCFDVHCYSFNSLIDDKSKPECWYQIQNVTHIYRYVYTKQWKWRKEKEFNRRRTTSAQPFSDYINSLLFLLSYEIPTGEINHLLIDLNLNKILIEWIDRTTESSSFSHFNLSHWIYFFKMSCFVFVYLSYFVLSFLCMYVSHT